MKTKRKHFWCFWKTKKLRKKCPNLQCIFYVLFAPKTLPPREKKANWKRYFRTGMCKAAEKKCRFENPTKNYRVTTTNYKECITRFPVLYYSFRWLPRERRPPPPQSLPFPYASAVVFKNDLCCQCQVRSIVSKRPVSRSRQQYRSGAAVAIKHPNTLREFFKLLQTSEHRKPSSSSVF